MPRYIKDHTNKIYGRLKVLEIDNSPIQKVSKSKYWICLCSCGIKLSIRSSSLTSGQLSCGCLRVENSIKANKARSTGNLARKRGTIEYFKTTTWSNVNRRTINGSNPTIKHNESYFKKNIKLKLTKSEWYNFCDKNKDLILKLYSEGKTPSVDRINSYEHYELNNMRIISTYENISRMERTKEMIEKVSESKYKPIILIHPNGKKEYFKGIKFAAEKYNLNRGHLSCVARNARKHHKYFKCYFYNKGKTHE